jgi:predicted Zn-dependent peptidase
MNYKLTTLENGLRVVVVPLPSLESATLTVWVGVGSRYEEPKISGLSHFLEHMVFKGGKKYSSAKEVSEKIDTMGAENNAGTAHEWTNFYIKARAGLIGEAFDVLSDVVLRPILKTEDINRERGVILEEIAMEEDTPVEKIGDVFGELIFSGSSLGVNIAGSPQTVSHIHKSDFVRYRNTHYDAKNIVITVAGGVDVIKTVKLAEKYFGTLSGTKRENAEQFISKQTAPRLKVEYKKSEQAHLILGFLGHPRGYELRYAESILATLLGRGMSSRLFTEVREKRGLAYAVGSSVARYVDTGAFATYAGVDLKRIDEAIKVILDQMYGLKNTKYPVSKKELNKAKEYLKGRMALALEDTNAVNDFFGQRVLFDQAIETPEQVFKKVDKVSLSEVLEVAKDLFVPEKLNLAIIGPYKDKTRFEKLIR